MQLIKYNQPYRNKLDYIKKHTIRHHCLDLHFHWKKKTRLLYILQ